MHGRCLLMKGGPGVELRTERKNKEGKVQGKQKRRIELNRV